MSKVDVLLLTLMLGTFIAALLAFVMTFTGRLSQQQGENRFTLIAITFGKLSKGQKQNK